MTKNIPNISKNNVKNFYGKIKLNSMFLVPTNEKEISYLIESLNER